MILTNWGYMIDELDDMLTSDEFETMTGNRYAGDVRTQPLLDAAHA